MHVRQYRDEEDYWRLRAFLREVFLLNGRRELSWQVARLDYWRFFINEHLEHFPMSEAIFILESGAGRIIGFALPDSRGDLFLNIHPDLRSREAESLLLDAAEPHLAAVAESGARQVTAWAHQQDEMRQRLLAERGYVRGEWPEYQRGRSLLTPIADALPAPHYEIRSLGDEREIPARSWLSWKVFHPDEPDTAYQGHAWYPSVQSCPMYRRDLDLVAVAPDGELAAFCTIWYDDVTRTGCFEPVGTLNTHQRKGLGKAIMTEGMRRVARLGAVHVTVGGYSAAANALYSAIMGPEYLLLERWTRTL